MIRARFSLEGDVVMFSVHGHAGTAPYGEDLVCAAVSALAQATVLGLEQVAKVPGKAAVTDGRLTWQGERSEVALVLIRTLKLALEDLATTYPQAITLEEDKRP